MPDELFPRGEQSRTAILEAAHDLFIQQGYHGTSMRQIAKNAGIALGGLYNHFASKEQVFEAVFLTYHPYHQVMPLLQQAQGDTVEALVHDAAERLVQVVSDRPDFLNLMFIELVEFKSLHAQQLFAQLMPEGLQVVQRVSQAGSDRLRPIPPFLLVRSFIGLFFAYYLTEIIFGAVAPFEFQENAMDQFVDIFLHGILRE